MTIPAENSSIHNANKFHNNSSVSTIQYSLTNSMFYPDVFLSPQPRFNSQLDLSTRNLPCVLFLHGSHPGGFDTSRFMASGFAHASNTKLLATDGYGMGGNNLVPFSLLNVSRPGYLESSLNFDNTFNSEALGLIRLLDKLSIKSIRIVALDSSSLLAMELASIPYFRERVKSLVLINPITSFNPYSDYLKFIKLLFAPSIIQNLKTYYGSYRNARNYHKKGTYSLLNDKAQSKAHQDHELGGNDENTSKTLLKRKRFFSSHSPDNNTYESRISKLVSLHCGELAATEMHSDNFLYHNYLNLPVLFSQNESRKLGIKSDFIKLGHFFDDSAAVKRQWKFIKSPICCITTSTAGATNEQINTNIEKVKLSILNNVQSNTVEFHHVKGGGVSLYPLSRVSNIALEFVNAFGL
ncbi:hypothetical protein AX774_g1297 [Zancudomyces culisetae]|uniref:AB hydrolase-1 domain-containing protein n=1 Tax=Zancudomyces culisetae TaxID=1213189 RepID=A0A1R1PW50_ZANCU|nr:hypothetical protein AX774_g1297 [Zancudomyces culisetae]|eukprot:OMH85154.1 hypothetical protein AX774_g1297 [Zancudomyces culisetae]